MLALYMVKKAALHLLNYSWLAPYKVKRGGAVSTTVSMLAPYKVSTSLIFMSSSIYGSVPLAPYKALTLYLSIRNRDLHLSNFPT